MEAAPWMDWILGGLALSILAGGLWMLLDGVIGMNNK
ncbi:NAD synthetase [Pseudanabaena sp. FACHB-2040]|nr:NAD synthetase [Cyanobacteria bacterium Co-bin8]MBD2257993.1 NAD synthetase [Pseudanabaena sp. FACHB-2040]